MNPFDIDNEVILELIKSDPTLRELYGFSDAESEAPMADVLGELSQYSRGDDRNLAHVAPGDTIIPPELLEADPEFADLVYGRLADAGVDPAKRVVDSGAARRNPVTGAQEFDWTDDVFGAGGWQGDYSFEDYYNDLLARDYYDNVVNANRGRGSSSGGYGNYVGAPGGTPPQTDETRYGDPTGDGYAPPATTPPATTPPTTTPPSTEPDVIGPEAPGATPPSTTEPPTSPTAPTGREGDMDTVLGIPPEIADLIDIGAEIPIPGPGNQLLPVIFGSVQDFIDWTKTLGVDPTGKSYDNILESVGGAIKDIADTIVGSIGGAVRGATVGRVNEYVRNAVLAGRAVEEIIQSAGEVFSAGGDGAATLPPPSTGAPATPGVPSTTTPPPPGGGLEPDFALPGSEEEDEDQAPAETAEPGVDVDSEGVPTQIEPPGVPNEEILGQMGTNQEEVLGKLDEAIAQGASNAEALEQVAQDLGTTKEELLGALGTTEENLKGYMDGVEGRLTERLDTLETGLYDKMQENLDAGMARADAIDKALEDLATEQGKSKDEILDQMGTNQDALMGRMDELEEGFTEALGEVRDDLTDLINAGIEAGKTQAEALQDALDELAEQQGKSTEELKEEIGLSEGRIIDALGGFEERMFDQMGADKEDIIDRVDDAIEQGKSNGEALADLAEELGVSVEYLTDALGTTEENLTDLINETQTAFLDELGTTKAEILDSVNEAIAEGKSANEALDELAEQLGTTKEDLLDAVDVSTDTIMDELAAFEERQNERLGNAKDEIIGKVNDALKTGQDERAAINDALDEIADDLGMTREEILDELGTTEDRILDEIGTSTDIITRDISDLGMGVSAQNLLSLLSQPGVTSQRVDVRETPLANIEDIYDFATIFRTPEQAEFYAAALEDALASGAITEEELRALLSRA